MEDRNRFWKPLMSTGFAGVLIFTLFLSVLSSKAYQDFSRRLQASSITQISDLRRGHKKAAQVDVSTELTITQVYSVHLPTISMNYRMPYTSKIFNTPDYRQTDPDYGGLPGGGLTYCGPVAVSNSLMWLDDHGYDNIASNTEDRKRDQFDLIWVLGPDYLKTSLSTGTGVYKVTYGVHEFIKDKGYQYLRLQYQGWRKHDSKFSTGVQVPDLEWVKQGVEGYSSAWINYGKYNYDAASDKYTRVGGHWVTLVGYGYDRNLTVPDYLIVHDQASWDYDRIINLYLTFELISSGTLVGDYTGLPRSAVGYYKITRSSHIGDNYENFHMGRDSVDADYYIMDGVVVLEMPAEAILSGNSHAGAGSGILDWNEGD